MMYLVREHNSSDRETNQFETVMMLRLFASIESIFRKAIDGNVEQEKISAEVGLAERNPPFFRRTASYPFG
jgi:hypothetical protein